MKSKIILSALLSFFLINSSYADSNITNEEKNFLNYGIEHGLNFSNYENSKDYRRRDNKEKTISYYEDGRYYYINEYTYMDNKDRKHYVTEKYYYASDNEKIYSIQDYYYQNSQRIYVKNEKELRNASDYLDIFNEKKYSRMYIDGKLNYVYEDMYRKNGDTRYVYISYYYLDDDKIYTIKEYYYDKNNKKSYNVDVSERKLTKSQIEYYLEYYINNKNTKIKDYYYDSYGKKRYYDDYYYDRKREPKYTDNKYTTERDFFDKLNDISYVKVNNPKYFNDYDFYDYKIKDRYIIDYNTVASFFPSKFSPNENTWPKKDGYVGKKIDFTEKLARQIKYERKYMNDNYFSQKTINNLLKKYFPSHYSSNMSNDEKLRSFLYHFGFTDAFYEKYIDTNDMRGFLYKYAEPMYTILRYYESGYYTDTDVNNMIKNNYTQDSNVHSINKKETKSQKKDKEYFEEKNRKILNER